MYQCCSNSMNIACYLKCINTEMKGETVELLKSSCIVNDGIHQVLCD